MKVCLSIAPASMAEALATLRDAPSFVDLVEVRIDGIVDLNLERLLKRPRPIMIVTNRRRDEGGKFSGSAREQASILVRAVRLGAEFVDIELSWGKTMISRVLQESGKTRVICSYHDFKRTSPKLASIYRRMRATGAHIIKIAAMANEITDNRRMFRLLERARDDKQPMIAFCMGEHGQISRVLAGKYGAFLTFGSLTPDDCTAPGQFNVEDLKYIYRIDTLNARTKVFGLVGNPVSHSKGIYFHNNIFVRRSLNAVYLNFLVTDLRQFLNAFRDEVTGLSVTMPFKEQIVGLLDSVEGDAARIRSVNSVINRKGKLCGSNTDLPAITSLLRKRTSLKNKHALVLGTGATSRTMAFATIMNGAAATIVGRSARKAQALARELHCSWTTFEHVSSVSADIVLNGTSVGLSAGARTGVSNNRLIPPGYFKKRMIVFDAVYNPPVTRLLRDAEAAECKTISGIGLFNRQAQLQSRLFIDSLK